MFKFSLILFLTALMTAQIILASSLFYGWGAVISLSIVLMSLIHLLYRVALILKDKRNWFRFKKMFIFHLGFFIASFAGHSGGELIANQSHGQVKKNKDKSSITICDSQDKSGEYLVTDKNEADYLYQVPSNRADIPRTSYSSSSLASNPAPTPEFSKEYTYILISNTPTGSYQQPINTHTPLLSLNSLNNTPTPDFSKEYTVTLISNTPAGSYHQPINTHTPMLSLNSLNNKPTPEFPQFTKNIDPYQNNFS